MEIPSEILNGEPGLYTFTYDGCEYRVVVGEIVPGNPVGVTVHGGGAGGGYNDTLHEQRALLDGQTIEEAMNNGTYNVTGQNQIDIFPVTFEGYYNWPNGKQRATNLVIDITNGIEENLGNPITYMPEGHSATARGAIKNAMLYAESGGKAEQIIAFALEPSQMEEHRVNYSEEEIQFMKDNNIIVLQVRGNDMCSDMNDNIKAGMPCIDVDFDLYTPNGGRTTEFWVNHRVPRTMLGDFDYSDIANGTFSWADVLGPDADGNYKTYYDEYNGITYTIRVTVKVYNIPGFTNGEEVPLDALDTYLNSLVMSDEEYLASEITNMKAIISSAKSIASKYSDLRFPYSTTKIPSGYPSAINTLIVYHGDLLHRLSELLDKIDSAKESFTLMDRDLYLRAKDRLDALELQTPVVEIVEPEAEQSPEKTTPSSTPTSYTPSSYTPSPSSPTSDDKTVTSDDKNVDDKSKDDKKTDDSKITSDEKDTTKETTPENKEDEDKNKENPSERKENPTNIDDDKKITKPEKDVKKDIPSKAKATQKKATTKKDTKKSEHDVIEHKEEPAVIEENVEERPTYPEEQEVEVPIYTFPEEQEIEDPPIDVPIDTTATNNEKVTSSNDANILKTIGIAAGIGAGVGAVAYGVNEQIRKKEYDDGFDYSYDTGKENSEYLEQESETSEYSPFTEVVSEDVGPYNVNEYTNGGEE